ncbi:MAG TPA: response regulator [Polyangiaceae bacterium]|nr:response regulator [Polyangiaceae bacterium]
MADHTVVLVVDDDELLQELVKISLEGEGYIVDQALDGAGMWRCLRARKPDLIVLDVLLPDTDGRKLVTALKQEHRFSKIPIVMWTARYRDAERDAALDLGADDFFEKGPPAELEGKIAAILKRFSERMPV